MRKSYRQLAEISWGICGGRFGQSLTAIVKLEPNAAMGDGLTIEYDGGSSMPSKVKKWLKKNGIKRKKA